MVDALPLGRQQLHQVGATVGLVGTEYLAEVRSEVGSVLAHLHSFVSSASGVSGRRCWELTTGARATRGGGASRSCCWSIWLDPVTGDTPIRALITYRLAPSST